MLVHAGMPDPHKRKEPRQLGGSAAALFFRGLILLLRQMNYGMHYSPKTIRKKLHFLARSRRQWAGNHPCFLSERKFALQVQAHSCRTALGRVEQDRWP